MCPSDIICGEALSEQTIQVVESGTMTSVGALVGLEDGASVGLEDGAGVGFRVGAGVGFRVGARVGFLVGALEKF